MVYLEKVRLSRDDLVGEENAGWQVARLVLANERMSMSAEPGLAWGDGPTYGNLLDLVRAVSGGLSPALRARVAAGYVHALALHVMRVQALGVMSHEQRGAVIPEVRRALGDEHGRAMLELWRDLWGPAGVALNPGSGKHDEFAELYFFARALTLGGGTSEIQRNILAERVLGLPRESQAVPK
jgi:alkylation response protein AidB-like acyl-CoA dehydrogenase